MRSGVGEGTMSQWKLQNLPYFLNVLINRYICLGITGRKRGDNNYENHIF